MLYCLILQNTDKHHKFARRGKSIQKRIALFWPSSGGCLVDNDTGWSIGSRAVHDTLQAFTKLGEGPNTRLERFGFQLGKGSNRDLFTLYEYCENFCWPLHTISSGQVQFPGCIPAFPWLHPQLEIPLIYYCCSWQLGVSWWNNTWPAFVLLAYKMILLSTLLVFKENGLPPL